MKPRLAQPSSRVSSYSGRYRYLYGRVQVTFIEPYPELLRETLGTETMQRVRLYDMRVQDVPRTVFAELKSGDILFIDSTHVMKTGSDVCYEFFEILPRLASGVLIHFHDMFWPFEYGEEWVLKENRSWKRAVRHPRLSDV